MFLQSVVTHCTLEYVVIQSRKTRFFHRFRKKGGQDDISKCGKIDDFPHFGGKFELTKNYDLNMLRTSFLVQNVGDATLYMIRNFLKRGGKRGGTHVSRKCGKIEKTLKFIISVRHS